MKNYIQEGSTVTVAAPANVNSGAGLLVGSLFGVAMTTVLSGANVEAVVRGVFDLAKVSAEAWTVGALIYWDNTAKLTTTVATANKLIGVAILAAVNPSATGRVRLNGAFIA